MPVQKSGARDESCDLVHRAAFQARWTLRLWTPRPHAAPLCFMLCAGHQSQCVCLACPPLDCRYLVERLADGKRFALKQTTITELEEPLR